MKEMIANVLQFNLWFVMPFNFLTREVLHPPYGSMRLIAKCCGIRYTIVTNEVLEQ